MKKLLIAFLLAASMCGAQTLTVPNLVYTGSISPAPGVLLIASNTATVSIPNNSVEKITGIAEDEDAYSEWDGATFTARIAQTVLVTVYIAFDAATTGYRAIYCAKNNPAAPGNPATMEFCQIQTPDGSSLAQACSASGLVKMAAGDVLNFWQYQTSGGALNRQCLRITIMRIR